MDLLQLCKPAPQAFTDLNFQQTVDVINTRLEKWSDGFKYSISALPNGEMIIYGRGERYFSMNLLDLKDPAYGRSMVQHGIATENCDYRNHVPASMIYFYNGNNSIGLIAKMCT
ncbi:MAG TPA: hypothetical protein VD794_16330 [Flavisolibacter sp.]|nr:hypothetical protein [Flavisolibacter sp.]